MEPINLPDDRHDTSMNYPSYTSGNNTKVSMTVNMTMTMIGRSVGQSKKGKRSKRNKNRKSRGHVGADIEHYVKQRKAQIRKRLLQLGRVETRRQREKARNQMRDMKRQKMAQERGAKTKLGRLRETVPGKYHGGRIYGTSPDPGRCRYGVPHRGLPPDLAERMLKNPQPGDDFLMEFYAPTRFWLDSDDEHFLYGHSDSDRDSDSDSWSDSDSDSDSPSSSFEADDGPDIDAW